MALALARKYRPKRFADVAVQSHVANTLQGAIARGRVAHGYLLCGPRGVGKTTLARVLAMALNCERPENGEPCGECVSCRRIWTGATSLDVVEIDAASNRGVDDARELRERAMYAPSGDRQYKVYIVDEAHMLTREAWNTLLKILEEPPPRVVFVFATTEPQKIAQAAAPVLSRLQRFDFKRIGPAEIRERMTHILAEEKVTVEPEALAAIARAADGSMRDALSLTDQVLSIGEGQITIERVRDALGLVPEDEYLAILDLIADRRAADVFPAVARLADAGIDFAGFLNGLADMIRAQLAVALGGTAGEVSEHARAALEARRDRLTAADLLRMLSAIGELEQRFRKSGQQQLLIETLLVRFALLDRSVEIEEILRALGSPAGGGAGARPVDRPSAPPVARPVAPSTAARPTDRPPMDVQGRTPTEGAKCRREERSIIDAGGAERVPTVAPVRAGEAPDVHRIAERWDALVERMRAAGKPLLATALAHSSPVTVTARGDLTLELDEPNDFFDRAVGDGRPDILAALREWFPGIERVHVRRQENAPTAPPKRLTTEMLRAEQLVALRKRDPVLDAAIDALDLEIVD